MMIEDDLRSEPTPQVGLKPHEIVDRATAEYRRLCDRYAKSGSPVNFDFRRHCLEWTTRGDHFTHRLHRYPARLTPYIPLFFLAVRGVAVRGGRLLDPFAGCGTVLVEAQVHPSQPMLPVGLEINPLARLIAKVKTTPLEKRAVHDAWRRIRAHYERDRSRAGLASFPNKRHWFTELVERRLARALRATAGLRDLDLRDFFLVAMSSVVRRVSLADPSVSVPVRIDPERFSDPATRSRAKNRLAARQDANVVAILESVVSNNLARLRAWAKSAGDGAIQPTFGADARTFKTAQYLGVGELGEPSRNALSAVNLVLTSPPYANAQRYTRSLRLEQFVLGFTTSAADERDLDVLQVGTERVRETEWKRMLEPTGAPSADKVISAVGKKDKYRAAIVGKYVRDMDTVVKNCYAALVPGGHSVFVIGNNCVRGRLLDNAAILGELGVAAGFIDTLRVRNKIPSRGLLTKRHPTAGVITHEHVIVLRKPLAAEAKI
jgi:hypothetical protein